VEQIVESTKAILRKHGPSALTTAAIAKHAGIPVGSIYQYFPNKTAIVTLLYDRYLANVRQVTRETMAEKPDRRTPRQKVRNLLEKMQSTEQEGDLQLAFQKAMATMPELVELENQHLEVMRDMGADYLKALGSPWNRPKLRRLCLMIHLANGAVWKYREIADPPVREYLKWQLALMDSLLEGALPEVDPRLEQSDAKA
jgi:AcrR family transcriptional regulator